MYLLDSIHLLRSLDLYNFSVEPMREGRWLFFSVNYVPHATLPLTYHRGVLCIWKLSIISQVQSASVYSIAHVKSSYYLFAALFQFMHVSILYASWPLDSLLFERTLF